MRLRPIMLHAGKTVNPKPPANEPPMSLTLDNPYLQLRLNPSTSTWSVESRGVIGPAIFDSRLSVVYSRGRQRVQALARWHPLSVSDPQQTTSPHGSLQQRVLHIGPDRNGLRFVITFAVAQQHPLLLWKIGIQNGGNRPVHIERLEMLRVGFARLSELPTTRGASPRTPLGSFRLYPARNAELAFFSQGWGSWSLSRTCRALDRPPRTRLGPLTAPMWLNPGTPRPRRRGHFASDMFAVIGDRTHRTGLLLGFLSQKQHFGSIEALLLPFTTALRMWANGDHARLDPGTRIETDWACLHFLHLDTPHPMAPYLDAAAREHHLPAHRHPTPTGWCSWYHYFQNISAGVIRHNLEAARRLRPQLPLQLIQIDDGYQTQIGDWLTFKQTFPHGPAPLAAEIRAADFTPGLWLAPFILHPRARLAADHPDWVLRNRWGLPVNAGFVWNTFTRALDLTHPAALDYVRQVIHTAVHEWGFSYLKLDFLYAAALPGRRRDPTRTRAQTLRGALQAIRRAAGEQTALLACGCPLGSALGLFDFMRISPDVAPHWLPRHFNTHLFFASETSLPAARNAAQNALTRAPLHRRWWTNDPDCLLLRPETELTLAEVQTLATVIAFTGGSLLLSDDLDRLPPERLQIAQALLPLIGQSPHLLDWLDNPIPTRLRIDLQGPAGHWHLLALFNWEDHPQDLLLRAADFSLDTQQAYHVRTFWRGETLRLPPGGERPFRDVPPHGSVVLALRPVRPMPQYLGGNLHISQGLEVAQWRPADEELAFTLTRPGLAQGHVDLYLPVAPRSVEAGNARLGAILPLHDNVYRLPLQFDRRAPIRLRF